ncbi:MAG: hypothetical protein NZM29_03860 [Nitrospira sp.]|nr:hypothetical protein [Nitrospira sp.]
MSLEKAASLLWLRMGLAAVYLLLMLALHPVLIQHELALPDDPHHSESDLCAWLDHTAGASLQSGDVLIPVADQSIISEAHASPSFHSASIFADLSRGPPL